MQTLKDKLVDAGVVSPARAKVVGLTLKQLIAARNKAVQAAIAAQGSAYNRTPEGKFRCTAEEQHELNELNAAIARARSKK